MCVGKKEQMLYPVKLMAQAGLSSFNILEYRKRLLHRLLGPWLLILHCILTLAQVRPPQRHPANV